MALRDVWDNVMSMEQAELINNRRVEAALERDKRHSLLLAVRARWIALTAIAALLPIINPRLEVLYYEGLLVLFALIGWAQLKLGRVGRSRAELVLIFCDLALLTITVVAPNPMSDAAWPQPMQYRFENFIYFFVLLAGGTLAYSWRTVIWMAFLTTTLWVSGVLLVWLLFVPDTQLTQAAFVAFGQNPRLFEMLDPNSLMLEVRLQEIVVFVIVAAMLGLAARRSQQLLMNQVSSERELANLARYFSPNVVEELSQDDEPLKHVRSQSVAVLFVDIVGFTEFAADRSPEHVIETLRQFHSLMEKEVFDHNGTLDKYLGDGLMATFGTPATGPDDALNALKCVRAMATAVERWNEQRQSQGQPTIRASFGLHYGDIVLGNIGSNRLEFTVIGNTVNIASRLEALTRSNEATLIASNSLIEKIRSRSDFKSDDLNGLEYLAEKQIRGLDEPVPVWKLPNEQPNGSS